MTVEFAFGNTGAPCAGALTIGLPLLGGAGREPLMSAAAPAKAQGGISLWGGPEGILGYACADAGEDLEAATRGIYDALLTASRGLNLYRIWNFVPRINAASEGGLENYRAFCRGRSLAFESALGAGFSKRLPAASAVGTGSGLTVAFLAGASAAAHHENPAQVPAYEYPAEHGPRPPSFARATIVAKGERVDGFISGTSAVLGHETVAPHDTLRQLECTFKNLRLISNTSGLGEAFGAGTACTRHFKVYLRNAGDLAAVAQQMEAMILVPGDRVTYLRADICRSALNVEIEVAVRGADRS